MLSCRFTFNEALQEQLSRPAIIVPVFERRLMQGETGAQAVVDLPGGLSFTLAVSTNAGLSFKTRHQNFFLFFFIDISNYDVLELDASLSCPGRRDETCAHWDHTVQLYICCDHTSPYCNLELGRWITAFRRCLN